MDLISIVFYSVFALIAFIVGYSLWSKRGQKEMAQMITGLPVVGEALELSSAEIRPKLSLPIKQDLRIYRCQDNDQYLYVLEVTYKSIGSMERRYVNLSSENIEKISEFKAGT